MIQKRSKLGPEAWRNCINDTGGKSQRLSELIIIYHLGHRSRITEARYETANHLVGVGRWVVDGGKVVLPLNPDFIIRIIEFISLTL